MKQSIFFAFPNLVSERWQQTFPNAVITDSSGGDNSVGPDTLCWVLTNLPGWELLIQRLVSSGASVVALSLQESRTELLTTLAAGGRGYVHALAAASTLQAVATTVVNGGLWLGQDFVSDLIKGMNLTDNGSTVSASKVPVVTSDTKFDSLTAREREVCLLVADAHSNKEVARQLNVTERTVKAHLGSAFEKLQVRDRVQLALLVNRLINPAEKSEKDVLPRVLNG